MSIVRVALDVPLSMLFDYVVEGNTEVLPGQRVLVPFGRKQQLGVAMECLAESEIPLERLKPITQVLTDIPPLPASLLTLLKFCSSYYQFPLGMTVLAALPNRLRTAEGYQVKQIPHYGLSEVGRNIDPATLPKRRVVQRRIMEALRNGALSGAALRELSSSAPAAVKQLLAEGWIEMTQPEAKPTHSLEAAHSLTAEQQGAVQAVVGARAYACFLLYGITGSGKTEVYVHLMHEMLQNRRQVLLLIPEINLTPQLEQYFRKRFPYTEIASLHSGLADGERVQNWLKAQSGEAGIVLGTRLAVFTPMPDLGLILVDEEHDASFKQQEGLRYSARDVAIFRANQEQVPIVLGSATPSLESWYNAQNGKYRLLELKQRAVKASVLPQIRCIDSTKTPIHEGLSATVITAIETRLQRGEQSLIFLNRRGYAPVLMCTACGWLSACSHCAGKLVLHLHDRTLRCHHCGHQQRVPHACPSCGDADLKPVGIGTQRVETALRERFPHARILRIDRDSTRNKGVWQKMHKQIQQGEADILLGTQMLAKGHDFPNVTLVAVLDPDGALYSADFRAAEKLFAQLTQVGGRAGRADKPGEVLIQTAFPTHPLYQALRQHDYPQWAQELMREREQAGFPPYVFQSLLSAESKNEQEVYAFLQQARQCAKELGAEVEIYGVVPAAMPKRAGHFRAQILIQAMSRKQLQVFLRTWEPQVQQLPAKGIRWSLDVDPQEL